MISNELREFVENILEQRRIEEHDVQKLDRDILGDSLISHEIIDVLVALDRTVEAQAPAWAEFLVTTTVNYVVWTCRPTGVVNRDLAQWLLTTLSIGEGPTANAMRIAFEVVREAERCDEGLIAFAMGKAGLKARQDYSVSAGALLVA
jgi:hypothetical protein